MNAPSRSFALRWAVPPLLGLAMAVAGACAPGAGALGQSPNSDQHDPSKHAAPPGAAGAAPDSPLAAELAQLRDKVAALEAALARSRLGDVPPAGGMGMMDEGEMGPMAGAAGMTAMPGGSGMAQDARVAPRYRDCLSCHSTRPTGPLPASHLAAPGGMGGGMMEMMGMGRMGQGGRPGMGMSDDAMMGMGAMGRTGGMATGSMDLGSNLPGFPGASHLYHIGADGFFLNHDAHITLSAGQRKELNRIKEKALLGGSSFARKVEEAEQELWELTASDTPDAGAIEEKVREIETLRGDQRLAFIRAVGSAAEVLTAEQRERLVGVEAADAAPHGPS